MNNLQPNLHIIVVRMVFYVTMVVVTAERVLIAVTVITWVLLDLKPIVVQIPIAGEKTPYVCLEFLVQSVATHGQCISLVLIVTNFLSTYAHTQTHTHTHTHTHTAVGMIILYNM